MNGDGLAEPSNRKLLHAEPEPGEQLLRTWGEQWEEICKQSLLAV